MGECKTVQMSMMDRVLSALEGVRDLSVCLFGFSVQCLLTVAVVITLTAAAQTSRR